MANLDLALLKHLITSISRFFTRISHEMRVGMRDLRAISGHRFDVFVTQSYYGKWP
jgi:hypothetical protein